MGLLDIVVKSGIEVKGLINYVYMELSKVGFSFVGGFDSFKILF